MSAPNISIETIQRFVSSLFGSNLASRLKITPLGLFIPENELTAFICAYQTWLKADSAAEGLLETNRCIEHIFETNSPTDYYLLDGKNCLVGNLIKLSPTAEFKSKFPFYAGTPIDGRHSIHPKDPILSRLPEGVQIITASNGMQLSIKLKSTTIQLPLSRLADIAYLVGNSPRLRKQKHTFKQALRKVVPELALLLKQARVISPSSLRFMPSQFRRRSDVTFLSLADLIFALNSNGNFISGFGFKAKNLLDFLHQEIRELSKSVRSKRIGEFDLRFSDRQIAGTLRSNQEKFQLEYKALMDFVQIWRPNRSSNNRNEAPTLFDLLRELSLEFYKSSWTLDRDISPRYRGSGKDNLNYRTTKGWVFWISKRSHLVSLRRRPIIKPIATPIIRSSESS